MHPIDVCELVPAETGNKESNVDVNVWASSASGVGTEEAGDGWMSFDDR